MEPDHDDPSLDGQEEDQNIEPNESGSFQCRICKRSYSRADHLVRHVGSHSNQRPFQCSVCLKGFGRRDLLKRHETCHGKPTNRKSSVLPQTSDRVASACKLCAESKLKCSGTKPCQRCVRKGLECISLAQKHQRRRAQQLPPPQAPGEANSSPTVSATMPKRRSMDVPAARPTPTFGGASLSKDVTQPLNIATSTPIPPFVEANGLIRIIENAADSTDFFSDPVATDSSPAESFRAFDILDFGIDANLDLDALDLGFLTNFTDCLNSRHPTPPPGSPTEGQDSRTEMEQQVSLGIAAFQRSLWLWSPARDDTGMSEHRNLSLPVDEHQYAGRWAGLPHTFVNETLSQSSRDQVLGMVLQSLQPHLINKVISSFPSADILNNFMHLFFAAQSTILDSWIHLPTFRQSDSPPVLLAAIIAAGAVTTSIPSVRKLGYALQEAVRLAMPQLFEADNSSTRDLLALQAYVLNLGIGIWSGNRRKIEIAESHEQPVVTMLRRAGRFRRWAFLPVDVDPIDGEEVVERKWRQWAKQESFKRLVFHLFLHDAQASMSLLVTPLINLAELTLPLPASRELWSAKDAQSWKAIYLATRKQDDLLPSLGACLVDLSLISSFESRVDLKFTSAILAHGLWGMVWQYRQNSSITRGTGSSANTGAVPLLKIRNEVRHGELAVTLERLRETMQKWPCGICTEVTIVLELLMMHLSVSFESLQIFAGKEGEDAARSVRVALVEWADDRDARAAVWHAGQILRAAKAIPRGMLGGFEAVAVYHASLTLWVFAVVSRERSSRHKLSGTTATVWLDEENSDDCIRFIEMQQGIPGVKGILGGGTTGKLGAATIARLDDPRSIMEVALEILQAGSNEDPLPPLVENLCQLIRDLGSAAKRRRFAGLNK